MGNANIWWILAGVVVALELATGTFYLLMLALGLAAGALAALAGVGLPAQLAISGVVGALGVVAWHFKRSRGPKGLVAGKDPAVSQDVGARVQVETWSADGQTRVSHRGASWSARAAAGSAAEPGPHRVVEVDGNTLVLEAVDAAEAAAA